MRALRWLAQNLGLVYRDDGMWRPAGLRQPSANREGTPEEVRQALALGVVMTCRGTQRTSAHQLLRARPVLAAERVMSCR